MASSFNVRSTSAKDELDIYIRQSAEFSFKVIIKSNLIKEVMERYDTSIGVMEVGQDDHQSRYFMNLAGEYHATDTLMDIISLDTLENIEFTKANLDDHKVTRESYQRDKSKFDALLNRYPSQHLLIKGILNPVDIDVAINAKDGDILYYPEYLVDPQEITLINDLQIWIHNYIFRWQHKDFMYTDELFPAAAVAIFHLNMMPVLLNLRLDRLNTNEVHSFHIRRYLNSNGYLDRFVDFLSLEQQLFIYRNINYIKKHAGHDAAFNLMAERLMDNSDISLSIYNFYKSGIVENESIPYKFFKEQITTKTTSPDNLDKRLDEILTREIPLAINNSDVRLEDVEQSMLNVSHNESKTKLVTSNIVDYTLSEQYNLEEVLFNHWAYLASTNRYKAVIDVIEPITREVFTLSVKDAFIFFLSLIFDSLKQKAVYVPEIITVPMVQSIGVPELKTHWMSTSDKDFMDSKHRPLGTIVSTKVFFSEIEQVFLNHNELERYAITDDNANTRASKIKYLTRLFPDEKAVLSNERISFTQWRESKKIQVEPYESSIAAALALEVLSSATGYTRDPKSLLVNVQKATVSILQQLSSYNVQFDRVGNESPVLVTDVSYTRLGEITTEHSREVSADVGFDLMESESATRERNQSMSTVINMATELRGLSSRTHDMNDTTFSSIISLENTGELQLADFAIGLGEESIDISNQITDINEIINPSQTPLTEIKSIYN